jgi:hypothetical protein
LIFLVRQYQETLKKKKNKCSLQSNSSDNQ